MKLDATRYGLWIMPASRLHGGAWQRGGGPTVEGRRRPKPGCGIVAGESARLVDRA